MKAMLFAALVAFIPLGVQAQKNKGEAATVKGVELKGDLKPGAEVTAVIDVALDKEYHTHSNKPSESQFIPTVLTVTPTAGVKVGAVKYPEGKSLRVKGLAKPLSVYEKHFQLSVPLTISADVKLPVTIPATLSYQACQGAVCFPPKKLKLEIVLDPTRKK
jgi:DsbC/DsbD-like thiol-disulfide interchange protein